MPVNITLLKILFMNSCAPQSVSEARLLQENEQLRCAISSLSRRTHIAETQVRLMQQFPAPSIQYVKALNFCGHSVPAFNLTPHTALLPGHVPVLDEGGRWLQCHKVSMDMIPPALQEYSRRMAVEAHIKNLEAQLATAEARADRLEQQLAAIEHTAATLKRVLDISTQDQVLGAHVFLVTKVQSPSSPECPTEPLPVTVLGHTQGQVDLTKIYDVFPQR